MLLDAVAVQRVVQKECEIGIQVKKRATGERIKFQGVTGSQAALVVHGGRPGEYASAVTWINKTKPRKLDSSNQVEGNLSRGIKIVSSKIDFESE